MNLRLAVLLLALAGTWPERAGAQEPATERRAASTLRGFTGASPQMSDAFRRRMRALEVRVPPDSLRIASSVLREGTPMLDVPLVEIITAERRLALELTVDPTPGLSCARRGCSGVVRIAVIDADSPLQRIPLPAQLVIDLYGPDSVDPATLLIQSTRTFTPVRVLSRTQEATLRVHPTGLPTVDVKLPVRRPQLELRLASRTMDGWGLERTLMTLPPLPGLDPDDTVDVSLQADGVRISPPVVKLTSMTGAVAEISSRRPGTGTITAYGPPYVQSAEARVAVTWPWTFIVFTLIGGLIGAYFRERVLSKRATSRAETTRRVLAAAAMGAVLAIGVALGTNLTTLTLPSGVVLELLGLFEAAVFAAIADALISHHRRSRPAKPSDPPAVPEHQNA